MFNKLLYGVIMVSLSTLSLLAADKQTDWQTNNLTPKQQEAVNSAQTQQPAGMTFSGIKPDPVGGENAHQIIFAPQGTSVAETQSFFDKLEKRSK